MNAHVLFEPSGGAPSEDGISERLSLAAFRRAAGALGARRDVAAVHGMLLATYETDPRPFGGLVQLARGLRALDDACADHRELSTMRLAEIELAFWLSGAVPYGAPSLGHIGRTVAVANEVCARMGLSEETEGRVVAVLRDKRLSIRGREDGGELLVGLDRAVLAADPLTYAAYERDLRQACSWLPGWAYARWRALRIGWALGSSVYESVELHRRYETAAQANLARTLAELRAGSRSFVHATDEVVFVTRHGQLTRAVPWSALVEVEMISAMPLQVRLTFAATHGTVIARRNELDAEEVFRRLLTLPGCRAQRSGELHDTFAYRLGAHGPVRAPLGLPAITKAATESPPQPYR